MSRPRSPEYGQWGTRFTSSNTCDFGEQVGPPYPCCFLEARPEGGSELQFEWLEQEEAASVGLGHLYTNRHAQTGMDQLNHSVLHSSQGGQVPEGERAAAITLPLK